MDGRNYTFSMPTVEDQNQTLENGTTKPSAPTSSASVFLPPALFKSINKTDVGIVFSVYHTASFFPIANVSNTTKIASIILGASVVSGNDVPFENLSAPVQFIFIISSKVWSSIMCKAMLLTNKMSFHSTIIPDMTVSVGTSLLQVRVVIDICSVYQNGRYSYVSWYCNGISTCTYILARYKRAVCIKQNNLFILGGRGNWTTNGCITKKDNLTSNRIECQCSHLTNFAILVVCCCI